MRRASIAFLCAALAWFVWKYPIPHKHLAPDGTFFLLQRVTKPTEFGVYSLGPGSEVHRVAQQGSTLTVSDGRQQFDVAASQLTNDLDMAAELQATENEEKRSVRSAVEREKRRIRESQKRMYRDHDKHNEERERGRQNVPRTPNPLDRGAYKPD